MSILNYVYSIYDRKALYYLPPFAARSDADAERTFTEAVMTSETPIAQYPADFDLVRVGAIDLDTGVLSANPGGMPHLLINGLVALQNSQVARQRYKAILDRVPQEEPFPDVS